MNIQENYFERIILQKEHSITNGFYFFKVLNKTSNKVNQNIEKISEIHLHFLDSVFRDYKLKPTKHRSKEFTKLKSQLHETSSFNLK